MEYLKKLTRFTDFASTTEVPFTDIFPSFIAAQIEKRKRNMDNSILFLTEFNKALEGELSIYKMPVMENTTYYNFFDSGHSSKLTNDD